MTRLTRRTRETTDIVDTPEITLDQQIIDNQPGQTLLGPGTLNLEGGVQGVDIKQIPEGYKDPLQQMQEAQVNRDRKRTNTLITEYSYSDDGANYMQNLGTKDQGLLNKAIEKRNVAIEESKGQIPQMGEYKPEDYDVDLQRKYQLKQRELEGEGALSEIGTALDIGVGQVTKGIGGALRFAGLEETGKSFVETGEKRMRESEFKDPITQEFDLGQLKDPRFWTQKFPQSLPFMVAGGEVAIAGGGIGAGTAGVIGLGETATIVTTGVFAGLSSRTFESYIEAGDVYNEALEQGLSEEKATEAGKETFNDNMKLAVTDAGQFILTFSPIKGKGAYKHLLNTAKIPANIAVEGLEEVYQGYASENALSVAGGKGTLDIDEYLSRPTTLEAFTLGGATGGVFGGLGVASDYFGGSDLIKQELQEQQKQLEERAKKGDDSYITDIDASIYNGDISQEYGQHLKKAYVSLKQYFLEKAEPIVEKIAEKTGAKMKFVEDRGTGLDARIEVDKDEKNKAFKVFTELEAIQVAKDEKGKFKDTELKKDFEDLGIDPKDFKDTAETQFKTEDITWLRDKGYMEGTLFTEKALEIFPGFKTNFPNLGKGVHEARIKTETAKRLVRDSRRKVVAKPIKQDKLTVPKEKAEEIQEKFSLRCTGSNCGVNAINSYVKSGEKGSIRSGIFIEGNRSYAEDLQIATDRITSKAQGGKPQHYWHKMGKQVIGDKIVGKKVGRYVTMEEINKQEKISEKIKATISQEKGKKIDTQKKEKKPEFLNELSNDELISLEEGYNRYGDDGGNAIFDKLLHKFLGRSLTIQEAVVLEDFLKSVKQDGKIDLGTETKIKPKLRTSERIKKEKADNKLATEIAKISKQPNVNDIVKLINKHGVEIFKEGTNLAVQKNMISKEKGEEINQLMKEQDKTITQAPTGRINNQQRLNILDMLGFDKLFKKAEEFKINIGQLGKSLKEIGARIHIVNAPEGQRVKLPFSLMGNKSATFKKILLPMIKKATEQGAKNYVEPFGGAGTAYYFADEMIESGIENIYINHFDNEKYQVVKAIKDGKIGSIVGLVDSAYDQILQEIGIELSHIPEIKQIMEDNGVEVGSKEFKELAEISFYPQYAKQFFEERPDTKLAIKGETTTTFKEWLKEHLSEKAKEEGKVLEGAELETATELVLNDRSVFENTYPEISKKISTVLDKYDNINIKDGDVDSAMLVSMSRHFRQRGDSGQKVVSASSGFQSVVNVRNKMIDGLTKYKQVFDKHGDKIHVYNQDGKEFITDMGKNLNNLETISYLDPPYVRTTGVYIKNQPKEIQNALEEYANTDKIDQLFEPMKDSIMMFTNDIDGKYFEALDRLLGDRMSKDIIGYKEGTTPTSLVTTTEIAVKPKEVGLSYYKILKDSYTKDIMKSLQEGVLPKISAQLAKHIAKFEQHFMGLMQKKFGDLTKIQDEVFKGKEAFEKLESSLETVVTGKDKQEIIREAKKWLKENKVTGREVVKMIDKINKIWASKQAIAKQVRNEVEKLRKLSTIDVESKKSFFDWFNKDYTLKKVPEKRSAEVESVDKIMKGEDFTAEDYEVFEKYLKDEKFYDKIEDARKQSIYNLTIDELNTLLDTVKYYEKVGKDYRKFKDLELNQKVEAERVKAEPQIKKIESTKPLSVQETISKESRLREVGIKAKTKTKEALLDATPMEWVLDEELNLSRTSYNFIEEPINKHRDTIETIAIKFDALSKELKITAEGWKKITIHGLSRRSDGKGKIKVIARMRKAGEDPSTFSDKLQTFASEDFLTADEKKMYDYMQTVYKDLGKQMQETKILLDNEMVTLMDEYFPIQMDWASNQDKFADTIDPNTIDNGSDLFRKTKTEQGFTKEATGLELVPELDASKIFKTHVSNVSYYTNMQQPIKQLNKLINEWGADKLGDLGYKFMKNYVDVIARQGILGVQSGFDRIVSAGVRNFQSAVLGFNPTTMTLQTSAILEGLAIGGNLDPKAYLDIVKAITGKREVWDMVTEKSGTVRNREYRNLFGNTTDKFDKGIMEKWNKYGFYGIQKADAVLSRVLWYSEYKRSLKEGKSEKDSIYSADTLIKKAMGHTHFEGKAMFVLKNERKASSVATVFQNFVLNHSAMLRYGGGKKVQAKYGKTLGYAYAFMFAGLLFAMYEELLRAGGRVIHKQKDYGSPEEKAIGQLISFLPYVSIIYGSARFDSLNVVSGWKSLLDGIEGGKEGIDWTRILKGVGTIMGVGGTAEFDRIYKGYLKESKEKKPTTPRPTRTTRTSRTTRRKRD